jgi:hypothetical protein
MGDFRVVSAGDLADEIVARLACNTLPSGIGEWIAKQAEHGQRWQQSIIYGSGGASLQLSTKMSPDGTFAMQLADINGCPFWETTLRPPKAVGDAG